MFLLGRPIFQGPVFVSFREGFSTEKMVDFSVPQFCGWSGVMGIKGFVGSCFFWTLGASKRGEHGSV